VVVQLRVTSSAIKVGEGRGDHPFSRVDYETVITGPHPENMLLGVRQHFFKSLGVTLEDRLTNTSGSESPGHRHAFWRTKGQVKGTDRVLLKTPS